MEHCIKYKTDERFIVHYFFINNHIKIGKSIFYIREVNVKNRAFLLGDAVKVSFFVRDAKLSWMKNVISS
jgi:branched-chain amino acid aminotransferase